MAENFNIEYWLQKCSICFDARLDFCVEKCRDQFCYTCFDRYVNELLNHAWGMSNLEVKCPVCSELLSESEWIRYVTPDTAAKYRRLNKPYPVFVRFCNSCDAANPALCTPDPSHVTKESDFVEIIEMMEKTGHFTASQIEIMQDESFRFLKEKGSSSTNSPSISALHKLFMSMYEESMDRNALNATSRKESFTVSSFDEDGSNSSRRKRVRVPSITERLPIATISAKIIGLESKQEAWKNLQFKHIANFSQSKCVTCDRAICFKCGESTWHKGMTCDTYLIKKIERQKGSSDSLANLKWKLANSKACPNCCIFISRDEGCNKVDCVNCGHRFCWVCLKPWSEDCGFYRCAIESKESNGSSSSLESAFNHNSVSGKRNNLFASLGRSSPKRNEPEVNAKPEMGVPNVQTVFNRIERSGLLTPPPPPIPDPENSVLSPS